MLNHNEIVQRVLEVAPDDINLVAIFGSRARGDHSEHSDLDVAVSTSIQDETQRFQLRLQIISRLDGPDLSVDVVLIEDANWALRYRIAKDGVVIFHKENDSWSNFIEEVLIYYPDYRYFERQFLRDTLGGS